jgi:signal transduction histidine kinase
MANAEQLSSLISDLLDQSRIEAGGLVLRISSFAPVQLVADVVSTLGLQAEDKGLTLTCAVDDALPAELAGDPRRLRQILVNLVSNAIKFTEDGSVDVRVYQPDDTHWAFGVSDTGPGIPERDQRYIFEPFRQVDGSPTRQHGGVGLGLSLVQQLVTLMGGEITLESQEGQGSTFTVVLPLVQAEAGS